MAQRAVMGMAGLVANLSPTTWTRTCQTLYEHLFSWEPLFAPFTLSSVICHISQSSRFPLSTWFRSYRPRMSSSLHLRRLEYYCFTAAIDRRLDLATDLVIMYDMYGDEVSDVKSLY
jgi:hypothetical protein